MILKLNEAAVFRSFDGDPSSPRVTCEVARGESRFRCLVPPDVSELLHQFDGNRTLHEVVGAYCRSHPAASRQKLNRLIENYFVPNGVLVGSESLVVPVTAEVSRKPHYVRFAFPLLKGETIRTLVSPLGALFRAPCLISLLVASAALHMVFYSTHGVRALIDITTLPLADAAIIVTMMVLSAFVHELGHAAALVRHGGDAREIGFAVYLMHPVLYTNVTDSWRLTRWRRIQVDAGGMYFDSIFLLVLFAANSLFSSRALELSFLWTDLMLVTTLNPVLRMDGYWLLADLAGSSGLREESVAALKNFLLSFGGRSSTDKQLTARKRVFLTSYALVSVCVFAWVYWYLAGLLFSVMIPHYPELLKQLVASLQEVKVVEVIRAFVILLWTTVMILAFAGFVINALTRAAVLARSFVRTIADTQPSDVQKGYEV
jgi:putative peptide zinc metalloprotease protein